ncbi:MAG: hypothetical protein P1V20_22610 [Verrucomicrobiales bacterium]|nr:hypothetical protein [Verrucomicrobiales bacterium]
MLPLSGSETEVKLRKRSVDEFNFSEAIEKCKSLESRQEELSKKQELLEDQYASRKDVFNGIVCSELNVDPDKISFEYSYNSQRKEYSLKVESKERFFEENMQGIKPEEVASSDLETALEFIDRFCQSNGHDSPKLTWRSSGPGSVDKVGFSIKGLPLSDFFELGNQLDVPESWMKKTNDSEIERSENFHKSLSVSKELNSLKNDIKENLTNESYENESENDQHSSKPSPILAGTNISGEESRSI